MKRTIVMKFGGKAVEKKEQFQVIAELIAKRKKEFDQIAVVVSAMADFTDELIKLALSVSASPPKREYDMLVSVGERISIALLAMALHSKNIEAVSFTGSQSGIITTDEHSDARIIDVRPERLLAPLKEGKVVIVAGFQGVSQSKEITTLGRGGSDTTAVAVALALQAEKVEFYKDVPGIFAKNPQEFPQETPPFERLNYDEAIDIVTQTGGRVLAKRAIALAKLNNMPLVIRSFREDYQTLPGTEIGGTELRPNTLKFESSDNG